MKLAAKWERPEAARSPTFPSRRTYGKALKKMLSRLNICSKESVVRQYDHEVQGGASSSP